MGTDVISELIDSLDVHTIREEYILAIRITSLDGRVIDLRGPLASGFLNKPWKVKSAYFILNVLKMRSDLMKDIRDIYREIGIGT